MPDIASITAAVSGLKTATEVVRYLRDSEQAFKTADLKLRIADLVDALANAKLALSDIQELLINKDTEIKRLTEALNQKGEVVRYGDAYYSKSEDDKPMGDPFCSHCFESKHQLIHINQNPKDRQQSTCPSCKNVFPWQRRQ